MQKTVIDGQIKFRQATPTDVGFIFNSWLRSYRYSSVTHDIPSEVYFEEQHKVLEGLCKRSHILLAVNVSDPAHIYGYITLERIQDVPVVHFIYIKETYRKLGLASKLMTEVGMDLKAPFFYTHKTNCCKFISTKFTMIYNPYLAHYARELSKDEVLMPPGEELK